MIVWALIARAFFFSSRRPAQLPNQEEACEVALVIFNAGLKNAPGILASGLLSRDSRRVFQLVRDYMLHTAGRVVERHRFDFRMPLEKVAALVQRHRMR